jgi:hypothetical protein
MMSNPVPMTSDTYLQDAAKAMLAADRSGHAVIPVLERLCPHIARQVRSDARYPDVLALWGRSCNVDENAGRIIVPEPILHGIGKLAGVPMRGRFVHAGLEHTYGYLFSLIDTPYGYKRDRWVTTDLEDGFGLDPTLLGDRPRQGTLLGNLSWFLAKIVFRRGAGFPLAGRNAALVAPQIVHFDYARLMVRRIVEKITLAENDVFLFTDLVPFPQARADARTSEPERQRGRSAGPSLALGLGHASKEDTLLIYSVQRGTRSLPKLITAFPVRNQMANDLEALARSPRKVRLRLRYNAYVRGLFGREVWGQRSLVKADAQN